MVFDTLEGGLLERGAYSKGQMKRVYAITLSVFLSHTLRIQDAIFGVKYIDSKDVYPKLHQNLHAKVLSEVERKSLVALLRFDMPRGLNREGAYLKFLLRGEGLIREGA